MFLYCYIYNVTFLNFYNITRVGHSVVTKLLAGWTTIMTQPWGSAWRRQAGEGSVGYGGKGRDKVRWGGAVRGGQFSFC